MRLHEDRDTEQTNSPALQPGTAIMAVDGEEPALSSTPSLAETPLSDVSSVKTTMHISEDQPSSGDGGLSALSPTLNKQSPTPRTSATLEPIFDDNYFVPRSQPQSNLRPTSQPNSRASSAQTSSSSLHALSEDVSLIQSDSQAVRRAPSIRSARGTSGTRRISHSKSSSISHPAAAPISIKKDHPHYPEQSFSVLQTQFNSPRPPPHLRSRSSHPSQNALYTDTSTSKPQPRDRSSPVQGPRTAGNTPISSPGLFSLQTSRPLTGMTTDEATNMNSPHLHPTHLQMPKETYTAEIEHDMYTGNKLINSYEILGELGRGQFGKVKKGRDIENDITVAIKIVPRYSKQRRLGRLGAPEDRVKKEVAILKKARHRNVVSLLEVIDDPSRHKVYIVLEYVEHGEIKWRTKGLPEINMINNRRLDRERRGIPETQDSKEQEAYLFASIRKTREQRERLNERYRNPPPISTPGPFSLEYGGETDEEDSQSDISRVNSALTNRSNNLKSPIQAYESEQMPSFGHVGTTQGVHSPDAIRGRAISIATSSISQVSSEFSYEEDDEHSFVPTLTLEEVRRAFRDLLLGLEFLHFQGIIHRDIKPANLLVTGNARIKISDFGVSYLGRPVKDEEETKVAETEATTLDDPRELARTVGTPAFYAPELCCEDLTQLGGSEGDGAPKITGAIDLWALGITLYAMVYGRLPFYADNHMGLYQVICESDVFLPTSRLVPVETGGRSKPTSPEQRDPPTFGPRRLDYELRFEEVPDSVRNLIASLLVKDPMGR